MIAVDTTASMALVLNDPEADACAVALEAEEYLLISAGTLAEVLIVAGVAEAGGAGLRKMRQWGPCGGTQFLETAWPMRSRESMNGPVVRWAGF
jgi:uncharacterized protein with PIN domain